MRKSYSKAKSFLNEYNLYFLQVRFYSNSLMGIIFLNFTTCEIRVANFGLRSQTFCYTTDFLLLIYICLKPRLFLTFHHKTTSKHPRIQKFWIYFAKKFCDSQTKTGKAPPPSWLLLCVVRPMACGNAYVKHSFQTFLKHNVANPVWNNYGGVECNLFKGLWLCLPELWHSVIKTTCVELITSTNTIRVPWPSAAVNGLCILKKDNLLIIKIPVQVSLEMSQSLHRKRLQCTQARVKSCWWRLHIIADCRCGYSCRFFKMVVSSFNSNGFL